MKLVVLFALTTALVATAVVGVRVVDLSSSSSSSSWSTTTLAPPPLATHVRRTRSGAWPEPMINTPFGTHPARCVHTVPSGAHVEEYVDDVDGATRTRVTNDAGELLYAPLDACDAPRDLWQVRSTVSSATSAAAARDSEQFPPDYDGWLAFTAWQHTSSIATFNGNFSVPTTRPQRAPQEIYIFTGLQNVNWIPKVDPLPSTFDIIQPVLQYPGDFGDYWSVKSWYVTLNSRVLVTHELGVSPGSQVYGVMERRSANSYFVSSKNTVNGQSVSLTATAARLASQPWAYNTLECYGCNDCSYEPTTPTVFSALVLKDATGAALTPAWTALKSPQPRCNEKATIESPSHVTIEFDAKSD